MDSSSLILGTVQLGMPYGVANKKGQPDFLTARDIVQTAWNGQVKEFDTAIEYGNSEEILGRILTELGIGNDALVNSKTDAAWNGKDYDKIDKDLDASLNRLCVNRLNTLLIHRESLLHSWDDQTSNNLSRIKRDGRVRSIGISVYTVEAALLALSLTEIDVVQIPTNLLDRRFEQAGISDRARQLGKKLQLRSIFLQGLLFLHPNSLPDHMLFAQPEIIKLQAMLTEFSLSPLEAAMGYVRAAWSNVGVLFGAESASQVKDNITAFNTSIPSTFVGEAQQKFSDVPEKVLNPSLWETR